MWKSVSSEVYHNECNNFISSSDLRRILRSPAHYKAPKPETTAATEFGTLAHEIVLEFAAFEARYKPKSRVDRRTKEGKQTTEWEKQLSENKNITFINADLYEQLTELAVRIRANEKCSELLTGGEAEISGFTQLDDINVKIRPDYLREDMIIDLKTTQDARADAFSKSVLNFGYDVQAALYVDAAKTIDGLERRFLWIAVEKDAPFAVSVFEASPAMLARGRRLYLEAINTFSRCAAIDDWPAYSTEIQTLELPRWAE